MISSTRKPYEYLPLMEKLKQDSHNMSIEERNRLKSVVALNASDIESVALYVDINGDNWAEIYPPIPTPKPISTEKAIDKFIETYGKTSPEEEELLEKLIFNPVPEYSGILAKESGSENAENMAKLAKEINSAPATSKPTYPTPPPTHKPVDDENIQKTAQSAPLTLELAKIFVKQGRFDRAYDIISKIILNNPEKSVYFADQMRFLEKLMKIQQKNEAKKRVNDSEK